MQSEIIARLAKNETTEIRVTRQRYKGRLVVDVREFYIPQGSSEWVPTRKGLTMASQKFEQLLQACAASR
jgi:Transcriptional Coactivator p15 (PC4)